jgi:hypothetical protein
MIRTPAVVPKGPTADATTLTRDDHRGRFEALCTHIGELIHTMARQVLAIAIALAEAKIEYEAATGSGHGKRTPEGTPSFAQEVADRSGVSRSLVEKYLRVAQLDDVTRASLVDRPELATNLSLLLRLVRADEDSRVLALDAYDEGGRPALDAVLTPAHDRATSTGADKAEDLPTFAGVDGAHNLSGPRRDDAPAVAETPPPSQAEQNAPPATKNEVAPDAAADSDGTLLQATERIGSADRVNATAKAITIELGVASEGAANRVKLGACTRTHSIRVTRITVPRAVLEAALAATADTGEIRDDNGNLTSTAPACAAAHANPPITDALISLFIQ